MSDQFTLTPSPDSIAAACSYCGKENPDRHIHCGSCGTYLSSEEPVRKKKSRGLAVLLVICFGPLGLLYVSVPLAIKMFCIGLAILVPVKLTLNNSVVFLLVGYRIVCAYLAFQALRERPDEEAEHLLEAAAELEKDDPLQAITVYEEIVMRFPGSNPSKEAARNIAVLKRLPKKSDPA